MINPSDREVAIFGEVRRLEVSQRAGYLEGACAGDAALRQRVEDLLRTDSEIGAFLEDSAATPLGTGGTARCPVQPAEKSAFIRG
jgi:hypothetical protein